MAVGALWPQCSGRSPLAPLPSRITRQARPTPSCSHTICALPAPPADACSQIGSVVCSSCPSYMTAHPVKAPIGVRVNLRLLAASDEPGQKRTRLKVLRRAMPTGPRDRIGTLFGAIFEIVASRGL